MKIQITKENISIGTKGSSHYCPVALALKDANFINVNVGCDAIYNDGIMYSLPGTAKLLTHLYDRTGWMPQFSFTLRKLS